MARSDLFLYVPQKQKHNQAYAHVCPHTHTQKIHVSGLNEFPPGSRTLKDQVCIDERGWGDQIAALSIGTCMESLPLFLFVRQTVDGQRSIGVNCREKTSWYTSNLDVRINSNIKGK